jgi:PTS system galactitol-specific IIC component
MGIVEIISEFFLWLYAQGAAILIPFVILILGTIFRAGAKRTLSCALRTGVGFTSLFALVTILLSALGPATESLAKRLGLAYVVPDVGWPVAMAAIGWGQPYAMITTVALFLLNAVLIIAGIVKTLNVDFYNYVAQFFSGFLILTVTGSWPLAIITILFLWFLTLKMADWTAPYIHEYYKFPGISIPHAHTNFYAPFGFLLNRLWDRIPVIKDIKLDPTTIRERLGIFGEAIFLGFIIGLGLGIASYISWPITGDQVGKALQLALTVSFFMTIIPRCAELIVMGLVPLSDAVREFLLKRMPGREIYVGLDVAVLVGAVEHAALAILVVPICYLWAVILPGNKVLPLADVGAYMIFFTVFAVNTCRGNLFRGLLNCLLVWIPISLIGANLYIEGTTKMAEAIGYKLPEGVTAITSLTGGSHFLGVAWYCISRALTGLSGMEYLIGGVLALIIYGAIWYVTRNDSKKYAEELKKGK